MTVVRCRPEIARIRHAVHRRLPRFNRQKKSRDKCRGFNPRRTPGNRNYWLLVAAAIWWSQLISEMPAVAACRPNASSSSSQSDEHSLLTV